MIFLQYDVLAFDGGEKAVCAAEVVVKVLVDLILSDSTTDFNKVSPGLLLWLWLLSKHVKFPVQDSWGRLFGIVADFRGWVRGICAEQALCMLSMASLCSCHSLKKKKRSQYQYLQTHSQVGFVK